MQHLKQYQAAQSLESYLGDPTNPDSIMSFKRVVEFDETEEFPEEAFKALHQWGTSLYYVPVEYGGKLKTYEELFSLIRVMSRRDLSVAVSDMHTLLGALPVWIKGTEAQKQRLAKFVCQNGYACLAVSEKAHGSDLLATATEAMETDKGYLLSGEKWPINKANLTHALTVLAKTDNQGSSRSLSLFLLYKKDLDSTAYAHLPKIKTLGLRAADISGISFKDTLLSEDALIGKKGTGLDLTLQGFYVTRTMCAFLSLGAADTAIRTALRLTTNRQLYNKKVFDLSHPKRILVNGFADILICDCVAISAARGLHVVPEQFSVWSAITKAFVTKTIEKVIEEISVIMGARFYLREEHDWGIFQKVYRDNGVISIFDGSSIVNLYALILQLRFLAKSRQKMKEKTAIAIRNRIEQIFSLSQPLPTFNGNNLELFSKGNNDILQGWEFSLDSLSTLKGTSDINPIILTQITRLTLALQKELKILEEQVSEFFPDTEHNESFESFEQAKRYCILYAAAACLHMWLYNRVNLGSFFAQGEWLVVCLHRLLSYLQKTETEVPNQYIENMAQELIKRYHNYQIFSIVPFQLAQNT